MIARSNQLDVAGFIRDRACVLGCKIHFASCEDFGKPRSEATCPGCAPAPTAVGSAICTRCFGRIRRLLREAPDLVGRLRSLSDPAKAMLIAPVKVFTRATEAIAPVGPDLLDAADSILSNLRDWAHTVQHGLPWHARFSGLGSVAAYRLAAEYSTAIVRHLPGITSDPDRTLDLAEAVTVLHPEIDGERSAWSIADAMNRWGAERRDTHVHPDVDANPDRELSASPVREWYDPPLSVKAAAERSGVKPVTVRKWVASGELPIAMRARGPRGSVMLMVYASQVDRVAALMAERRNTGRPAGTTLDTPEQEITPE